MNRLKPEKQEAIVSALVEGNSVRSVERMTGVHRDTITRLVLRVGSTCEQIMDETMHDLGCERIEVDEVWSYVGKKQRHVRPDEDPNQVGDCWTWVALDADSKLVPAYAVGKRDFPTGVAFIRDLASRLSGRPQISSDGLRIYVEAIEAAFGSDVDYAQIVKTYEAEAISPGRYSLPACPQWNARRSSARRTPRIFRLPTSSARTSRSGCRCAGSPGSRTRSARARSITARLSPFTSPTTTSSGSTGRSEQLRRWRPGSHIDRGPSLTC